MPAVPKLAKVLWQGFISAALLALQLSTIPAVECYPH